jgi:hypothetical protein
VSATSFTLLPFSECHKPCAWNNNRATMISSNYCVKSHRSVSNTANEVTQQVATQSVALQMCHPQCSITNVSPTWTTQIFLRTSPVKLRFFEFSVQPEGSNEVSTKAPRPHQARSEQLQPPPVFT